ncbi:hypothetical protein B0H14DRAFT_3486933 [Mycena olivaceomarginata]|nr:hypothetical protein B0H14DRAFT_3486933 [Mycena olivaceomarginata]
MSAAHLSNDDHASINSTEPLTETWKWMQSTFTIEPAAPMTTTSTSITSKKTNTTTFPMEKGTNAGSNTNANGANGNGGTNGASTNKLGMNLFDGSEFYGLTGRPTAGSSLAVSNSDGHSVRLPTLFSNSFGPTALLYPSPSLAPRMNYGEAHTHYNVSAQNNNNNKGREQYACVSTNAYDNSALLTLDPHAVFAHHFRNASKHATNAKVATLTTSGDGRLPNPHLSPNAYFLQELDEVGFHSSKYFFGC